MIDVMKVSKSYGQLEALADVSFHIPKGTSFGLVGPNGAGKSTIMKILSGVLLDFDGEIVINNQSVTKERLNTKKLIGYIPQEVCLEETLTAKDNLILFGNLYGLSGKQLHHRIEIVLKQIGLHERAKDKVTTFSGGMKRRLNIGCALLHEPTVVVMDEPTVGIDPQSRNSIFSIVNQLKESGSTIIYSSHYMEEVEQLCDSVALIDKGTLIEFGRMAEVLERHSKPCIFVAGDDISKDDLAGMEAEEKGNGYLVYTDQPLFSLEKLIKEFNTREKQPHRLELYQPKLEDIFFNLTGTQLRDQ
ncbi:ABC transporter ATP-binding protein [Halobacillus salinarum]|uniref:ABC transporter ATP-binding protein n=1 Tax=Halobacillus salinarum TaxID=2932257 RepID=A0ABY4EEF2_9BACI|nr:ABC transporter ATP-binding protein [Halobacillus salinarum]UOQ42840.1 ABC transporter ATP-binding protein [Halobacillus salinarum]